MAPVTYASTPSTWPSVPGIRSWRRVVSASIERSSVPRPDHRDRDHGDVAAIVGRDVDRVVHQPRVDRLCAQLAHRAGDLRTRDVVGLDDDHGRQRAARELGLDPVVRLHDRQVLRQAVRARLLGVHVQRRDRQRDQQAGGRDRRDQRAAQDAIEDRVPDPRLAVGATQSVQERDAPLLNPVAELRQHRRQHRERAEHGHGDDHDRADRERHEGRAAGQEHAGHRDRHGQPRDEHGPAGGRGGDLQGALVRVARRAVQRAGGAGRTASSRLPRRARPAGSPS